MFMFLGEECQALRDLEKGSQTKTSVMYPVVKPSSIEITNALNTLQRFESLHVHDAAIKQSTILTYFNRK